MKRTSLSSHRLRLFLVAAGVAAAAGGAAYAMIPSTSGLVSGCYSNRNGALRVIDAEAGAACVKGETAISWSQNAPAAYSAVNVAFPTPATSPLDVVSLSLPAGKYLLVGKGQVHNQQTAATVVACNLDGPAGNLDSSTVTVPAPAFFGPGIDSYATLAFSATATLTAAGAVTVSCSSTGPETASVQVVARLGASSVGSINP